MIGCYVYMALCVVCVAPPLSLTRVIRIDDPFEGVNHEAEDEAFELIIVVNAFACAFFGSNFICFYNAFTLQVGLGLAPLLTIRFVPNKYREETSEATTFSI